MPESSFETRKRLSHGRSGKLETPHGTVETPAFFPVLNFIGGPTPRSGGIWSRTRERLFKSEHLQGAMFQAMDFMNFDLSAEQMSVWRKKPMHEWFDKFNKPLFVDSGGFSLMNSEKFGESPTEGGEENEYGIYTNPESILDLQNDYGADIIASLDYPIPQELKSDEKEERMERSIQSAVRGLKLLEKYEDWNPSVYVAIHGHDYETINWYVSKVIERTDELDNQPDGFAIGSLVPMRSKTKMLVDIVQGAKDAIPEYKEDEIGLHVFGISGRVCPLLVLLGVDSFDSSAYVQGARYRKLIHPETWSRVHVDEIEDESWLADPAFEDTSLSEMRETLNAETSYKPVNGHMKSDFYARIAHHNFLVHVEELKRTRQAVEEDRLLEYVVNVALGDVEGISANDEVERGLKRAQLRDTTLQRRLQNAGYESLVAGAEVMTFQSTLPAFGGGMDDDQRKRRTISLEHGPSDFNVLNRDYTVPNRKDVLLVIPCSQQKPYSESRTQRVILERIEPFLDRVEKVTVSGLYGPVPNEFETEKQIMEYEYVLTSSDDNQIVLVTDRLRQFLEAYRDEFEYILGYATSRAYREAIQNAFNQVGRGEMFPRDPQTRQLTEHFRNSNIQELVDQFEHIAATDPVD